MSRYLGLEVRQSCKSILKLGSRDGAKRVCLDHANVTALSTLDVARHFSGARQGAACLVYSFGSRNEWSFDMSAQRYGCEVHTFDPTIGKQPRVPAGIHFHPIGLGAVDGARIKSAEHSTSHGGVGELLTLATIRRMLNHTERQVTLLKFDIEGQEWGILQTMVQQGMVQHVGQLLMEIHYWGSACLRKIDEWFDDARSQELCKRWGVQKPGGSHKLKMKACFLGMCIEHPPTADELSSMSAAMHGLRQQGLSFYSIVPNTEHSTASTRMIGRSENGSVAAALDESTGGLCCYEVGLSRSTL